MNTTIGPGLRIARVPIVIVACLLLSACGPTEASPDTSVTVTALPNALVLRPSGIGPYRIGDPADQVIEGLSSDIGGWDADSMDEDSTLQVPDCDPSGTRLVAWGNLVLFFTGPPDSERFATWTYGFDPVTGNANDIRRLNLVTEDGIGLGTSRSDVERMLGGRLEIDDDTTIDVATFSIDGTDVEHIAGRFTSVDAAAPVQTLARVPGCDDAP